MGIEIRLAKVRGFCAGVERALQKVEAALETGPYPVYVLHEIVHNETVVGRLRERGVIFIDDPEEAEGGTLIFSAHGVSRAVEDQAAGRKVKIVDATCPIVKSLHRKMEEFAAAGKSIVLFGRNGHREVEGLLGRVAVPVTVIESETELEDFLKTADRSKSYACLSQTTLNAADVVRMSARLKAVLPDVTAASEVCHATRERQEAVKELAKECPVILVVGSLQSSNTRRLYETALAEGVQTHLLGNASEFRKEWLDGVSRVGITSGASAPEELVKDLCEKIHLTQKEEQKMKKGDIGAILFLIAFACAVVFFPWTVSFTGKVQLGELSKGFDNFGKFTAHFPYLMGFFKVGLLATFGEMLKVRVKTGSWKVPSLFARFIVWGVVGLLFTFVFALFGKGVGALIGTPLWFGRLTLNPNFWDKLLFAFSTSFWQNVIFAFPMMLGHEWCNEVINQKRFVGGAEFLEKLNKPVWGSFIPKTIVFFWIPAHTVTFLLPPDYRVLMSAVLSLVLGAILTFRSGK